jgi:4'-phosphopantetheinyl transferase
VSDLGAQDAQDVVWQAVDRVPPRPQDLEIHLWLVDLHPPPAAVSALGDLLDDAEQQRAGRFHFERHRRRFTVRRGVLRALLGAYLDREPAALRFEEGPKGKPSLSTTDNPSGLLRFNLSDSEDQALIAVGEGAELGVDIESLDRASDLDGLAERFFSTDEHAALAALPSEQYTAGFFRAWTRKEAYLKAIGTGLSTPLDACTVTVGAREPARFVRIEGQPGEAGHWSLHHLEPAPGYLGALALRRHGNRLRRFRW